MRLCLSKSGCLAGLRPNLPNSLRLGFFDSGAVTLQQEDIEYLRQKTNIFILNCTSAG